VYQNAAILLTQGFAKKSKIRAPKEKFSSPQSAVARPVRALPDLPVGPLFDRRLGPVLPSLFGCLMIVWTSVIYSLTGTATPFLMRPLPRRDLMFWQ
jgi:hypothetical protein